MLGCTVTPDRVDKDDRAEERTGRPWCHGAHSWVRTPPRLLGTGGPLAENGRHHPPDGRMGAGGFSHTVTKGLLEWETDLAGEAPRIRLTQRARTCNQ